MNLTLLIAVIVGILGFYVMLTYRSNTIIESFKSKDSCPNILIQKGNKIYLKNTRYAEIPGVNPIVFNNLEDYAEFVQWMQSQNVDCPILFLQQSYDAQGNQVYKFRPDPLNPEGGLPPYITEDVSDINDSGPYQQMPTDKMLDASRNDPPYNQNQYPGFDGMNQYIGEEVPIDKMFHEGENLAVSDQPTDANWGGAGYTRSLVKAGAYKDNEVSLYVD